MNEFEELRWQAEKLYHQGDLAGAEAGLREYLRLVPDDSGALESLGHVHFEAGDYALALACYTTVVSVLPHKSSAHLFLASTLHRVGHFVEADETLAHAEELLATDGSMPRPEDAANLRAEIIYERALLWKSMHRDEDAMKELFRALAIEEGHPRFELTMAEWQLVSGHRSEAAAILARLVEPDCGTYWRPMAQELVARYALEL